MAKKKMQAKKMPTKKAAPVVKKPKIDPRIEKIYEEEITFMCPKRGMVTQKVKIKKFRTACDGFTSSLIVPGSVMDAIENKDDGLSIYKESDLEGDDSLAVTEE